MTTLSVPRLTAEEIRQFRSDGYIGPFTMHSPEEMAAIRESLERDVLTQENVKSEKGLKDRHLDQRRVFDLAAHPAVIERAAQLLGPDLLLFASSLFVKEPGFPPFIWHNDAAYWPLEPLICVTAWIALTDATVQNGCVSILAGSHKKPVPHVPFGLDPVSRLKRFMGKKALSGLTADPQYIDRSREVFMEVKAGQFFMFSERVIHKSGKNNSPGRRMGLASRITVPLTDIDHDKISQGHAAILVHGEDRTGFNRLTSPPE